MIDKGDIRMLVFDDEFNIIANTDCTLVHINSVTRMFTSCDANWNETKYDIPRGKDKRKYVILEIRG